MKQITIFINARLGSERVKEKMIRPFADSCLLEIALRKVLQCKAVDKESVYLGAYEERIKEIGRKVGVKIYHRTLESTREPVTLDVVCRYAWEIETEYFMNINACNPLLSVATIQRAIEYFQANSCRSLFSVVKRKNFYFDHNSRIVNGFDGDEKYLRTLETKMVEPLYEAAHSIYIWKRDYLIKELGLWSFTQNDPYLFEIPSEEAFDIDYPWQFELAEQMYLKHLAK
ncbi:MAG: hypothetical protein EXS63_08475 [Candidatus Omnitrophica bacterium]|nr:hypothetical protein [Candidatus Omnitrophota bacterium]